MNIAMLILYIFMGIDVLFYFCVASYIFYRTYLTRLWNMFYLASALSFLFVALVFYVVLGQASLVFHLLRIGSILWIVKFVKATFYKEKSSPWIPILIYGILSILGIGISFQYYINQGKPLKLKWIPDLIFGLYILTVGLWQFSTGINEQKKVSNLDVQPYIKKRYQIFLWSSIGFIFTAFVTSLVGFTNFDIWTLIIFIGVSLGNLIYVGSNAFLWIMPERIKVYLNKGWKESESISPEVELTEEELMAEFLKDSHRAD